MSLLERTGAGRGWQRGSAGSASASDCTSWWQTWRATADVQLQRSWPGASRSFALLHHSAPYRLGGRARKAMRGAHRGRRAAGGRRDRAGLRPWSLERRPAQTVPVDRFACCVVKVKASRTEMADQGPLVCCSAPVPVPCTSQECPLPACQGCISPHPRPPTTSSRCLAPGSGCVGATARIHCPPRCPPLTAPRPGPRPSNSSNQHQRSIAVSPPQGCINRP